MNNNFSGFNKEKIDEYLKELEKALRKQLGRKNEVELIIVGGASILLNYGFRNSTQDIDAFVRTKNLVKEAINEIGDKHGLPNGWINQDFVRTNSFSPKIAEVAQYYRNFGSILKVKTVKAEYLVAMKLASSRPYKYDNSDVIGIVQAQKDMNDPITIDKVTKAVEILYNGWENMPQGAKEFLEEVLNTNDLKQKYLSIRNEETENKNLLLNFEKDYPDVLSNDNLDEILSFLNKKQNETNTFGQIISKARKEKGLSISEVGKAINKNVLCLEYMEKDIHKPTDHSVHVLAEFYGLDEAKLKSSITAKVHYDREGLENLKNQGR